MDTTILRFVIAAIGVIVVLSIYLWDYFCRRKTRVTASSGTDVTTDRPTKAESWVDVDSAQIDNDRVVADPLNLDPLLAPSGAIDETERLSIHPSQGKNAISHPSISTTDTTTTKVEISPASDIRIIQFSLIPKQAENFSGDDLLQALTDVGLEYGKPGIFHRYLGEDKSRELIFSVTSMIEPGTFPIDDMGAFQCPGITLFLQTDRVVDPLEAFDDLTDIGHQLVFRLFGKLLDAKRQEVTMNDIIEPIRESLKAKIIL